MGLPELLLRGCAVERALDWVESVVGVPAEYVTVMGAVVGRWTVRGSAGEALVVLSASEPSDVYVAFRLPRPLWQSVAHCARAANHALGCPVAIREMDEPAEPGAAPDRRGTDGF